MKEMREQHQMTSDSCWIVAEVDRLRRGGNCVDGLTHISIQDATLERAITTPVTDLEIWNSGQLYKAT